LLCSRVYAIGFACDKSVRVGIEGFLGKLSDQTHAAGVSSLMLLYPRSAGVFKESVFLDQWLPEYGHGIPDGRL
jgi:hypothetical protein